MSRKYLSLGVSAIALTIASASIAEAQQYLPTINVGSKTRGKPQKPVAAARNVTPTTAAPAEPVQTLGQKIDGDAPNSIWSPTTADGKSAYIEKWQLPSQSASITRTQIERTINIVDSQDAVKYMPSLFVRKRNNGDTDSVLETRTWGINSSARSLVYADDLLLTPLIANNNTTGAPRFGLIAPEEIERVDFLYGPFSAQYAGNSMGGVLKYTTRMPEKLTATAKNITNFMDFSQYGEQKFLVNNVTQLFVGDKINDFMWNVSGNWQRGSQQPLTYVVNGATSAISPALFLATPGAFDIGGKFNQPTGVIGSASNLVNDQVQGKAKFAYDLNTTTRATYTLGLFSNDGTAYINNYLVNGGGEYFGGVQPLNSGGTKKATADQFTTNMSSTNAQSFANGRYRVQQKLLTNAGAIKSNTGGLFDYEISASNFTYLENNTMQPNSGAVPYGGWTSTGRVNKLGGTYWTLFDANGIVRPDDGLLKGHNISFGMHGDQFNLNNPTYYTLSWPSGEASAYGFAQTIARGTTRTKALWVQDAKNLTDDIKLTVGLRAENWMATNGINQSNPVSLPATGFGLIAPYNPSQIAQMNPIYQPNLYSTRFSPKGSLEYKYDDKWTIVGNIGMANRFATVSELYSLALNTSAGSNVYPNPYLKPEVALNKEINFNRKFGETGNMRVTLFDEEVRDAIIAQYTTSTSATSSAYVSSQNVNIQRIRNSGVEATVTKDDVFLKGLEMSGNVTWVNSRIISDPTWIPSTIPTSPANVLTGNYDSWCWTVVGKRVPYVPEWRYKYTINWRPDKNWSFFAAMRYQSKIYSVFSNNDTGTNTYQGFDRFFLVDLKATYKTDNHWMLDLGIDNVNNYKYTLFHPFPQRTYYLSAKYELGDQKKGAEGIFAGDSIAAPDINNWIKQVPFTLDPDERDFVATTVKKAPTAEPITKWGGIYAGINAGGAWGSNSSQIAAYGLTTPPASLTGYGSNASSAAAYSASPYSAGTNFTGFIGGGQIGYNRQVAEKIIIGAETDIQAVGSITGNAPIYGLGSDTSNVKYSTFSNQKADLNYLGTVRGRFGYAFAPTLLIFGTGGLAYGGVNAQINYSSSDTQGGAGIGSSSSSTTLVGWNAGGGVEWMFMTNWSVKAEYLYYNLGNISTPATIVTSANNAWSYQATNSTQFTGNLARAGVNYHLNWDATPVVLAKY